MADDTGDVDNVGGEVGNPDSSTTGSMETAEAVCEPTGGQSRHDDGCIGKSLLLVLDPSSLC